MATDEGGKNCGIDYDTVMQFVKKAHANQCDKSRKPYINHLIAVADGVEGETAKIVALLHDIIEDTDCALEDLRARGFSEIIIQAVDCLTKRYGESYNDYLIRVASNETATDVKISDLKHNSDLKRLKYVNEKDIKRKEKYKRALFFLQKVKKSKS